MASSEAPTPKAIIHQRVLEQAKSEPDASLNEIAAGVSGATVDLVERVLDEYGDPADSGPDSSESELDPDGAESTANLGKEPPAPQSDDDLTWDEFSGRVHETLGEVYRHPEATQQEIADAIGVSAPTVSNRLSELEGFDWSQRQEFVARLPEPEIESNGANHETASESDRCPADIVEKIDAKPTSVGQSPSNNPELVHKVLRVCMDSEEFTEAEEIELIERLM